MLKLLCDEGLLTCNSMLINLLSARDRLRLKREERATARLQRQRQREQEGRRSEQTEVREARLDRQIFLPCRQRMWFNTESVEP